MATWPVMGFRVKWPVKVAFFPAEAKAGGYPIQGEGWLAGEAEARASGYRFGY